MKRIGIIGTRRRNTREDFKIVHDAFLKLYEEGDWIVSGGCPEGGDKFAYEIYKLYKIPYLEFPANWTKFGRGAGFVRNTDIAKYSDVLIACVHEDRKGGTEDTIKKYLSLRKEQLHLT